MSESNDHALVARRWFLVAHRNMLAACAFFDASESVLQTAVYHCQHAVEKLVKGRPPGVAGLPLRVSQRL